MRNPGTPDEDRRAPPQHRMGATEWLMLIALSLLWGGSFFFTEIALFDLPVFTLVALRVLLAAAALHVILRVAGLPLPRSARIWAAFFTMGFFNNLVPFSLIVWGQTHIASGLASILNATTPLFTVLLAHLLTREERLTANRASGVVIGFLGVVVLIGPSALTSLGLSGLAQIACLAAALSYAFAGVFGRRFRQIGVSPLVTATGQLTASATMLVPLALVVDRPWTLAMPGAASIGAILGIALLSTALAYVIYFRLLASAGATNLLLVTFLIPVSAILLGAVVLGEVLEPRHIAGMALIGLGLAAIDGRLWRLKARAGSTRQA